MTELGPVVVRSTLPVTHDRVWEYLTDPELRSQWWESVSFDATEGGEIHERVKELRGTVDVVAPGLTLGFRWAADEERDRTVMIMLRPEDDDYTSTRLTVIESGFAALSNAKERVSEYTGLWEKLWAQLGTALAPEAKEAEETEETAETAPEVEGEPDVEELPADDTVIEATSAQEADPAEEADSAQETDTQEPVTAEEVSAEEEPADDLVSEGEIVADEPVADEPVIDEAQAEEPPTEESSAEEPSVETVSDEKDEEDVATAILLPEMNPNDAPETGIHITQDLGVDEELDVEETSEWERLLRGDDID